jgi:uncharacterized protein with HEPN domain
VTKLSKKPRCITTKPRDIDRLHRMLEAAQKAVAYSQGKLRAEIQADEILTLALIRLLEVVGEAARCTTEALQARHPAIPWPEIIGMRTWVAHGYMDIDLTIIYGVLTQDLPPLINQLPTAIAQETK